MKKGSSLGNTSHAPMDERYQTWRSESATRLEGSAVPLEINEFYQRFPISHQSRPEVAMRPEQGQLQFNSLPMTDPVLYLFNFTPPREAVQRVASRRMTCCGLVFGARHSLARSSAFLFTPTTISLALLDLMETRILEEASNCQVDLRVVNIDGGVHHHRLPPELAKCK